MPRIKPLDLQTANSIAAGEVVERPASVVKELVENSLDAGADTIHITIRQGGVRQIKVSDNGCGMSAEDALLAFGRHTTSKLRQIEDLDHLTTMGFRGEALASIAAVSQVNLQTREPGADQGFALKINGGTLEDSGPAGCPDGTVINIENLFFNVPARFKFLRKDATEAGVITDIVTRLALARPDVSFRLLHNDQEILHTPGNHDLSSTIYALFGRDIAKACLSIKAEQPPVLIVGQVGRPEIARGSRSQQIFLVNGRVIRSRVLTAALDEAYKTLLMKGRFAFAVLALQIPMHLIDVNVHPQKMEVRFWNDQEVFRAVYHAVRQALFSEATLPETGPSGVSAEELTKDQARTSSAASEPASEPGGTQTGRGRPDHDQMSLRHEPAARQLELDRAALSRDKRCCDESCPEQQQEVSLPLAEPTETPAAESSANDPATINILSSARYIGHLFHTYLLLEYQDDFLLIDQHAAHEKILFEELVRRHQARLKSGDLTASSQQLLVPLHLGVSAAEMQWIRQEPPALETLGFDLEPFGDRVILIRAIPDGGRHNLQPEQAFRVALDQLMDAPMEGEDSVSELFYTMACKAAVKAHDHLDAAEIETLLADLQTLDNPYQCPHGRPVVVRISRYELEKRFRRIV